MDTYLDLRCPICNANSVLTTQVGNLLVIINTVSYNGNKTEPLALSTTDS